MGEDCNQQLGASFFLWWWRWCALILNYAEIEVLDNYLSLNMYEGGLTVIYDVKKAVAVSVERKG